MGNPGSECELYGSKASPFPEGPGGFLFPLFSGEIIDGDDWPRLYFPSEIWTREKNLGLENKWGSGGEKGYQILQTLDGGDVRDPIS